MHLRCVFQVVLAAVKKKQQIVRNMVRGMLSWEDSCEEHSLFNVLQMGDANNVEIQSVNEDVLLRSDGPAAGPSASIQQPPQPSVAQTTDHGTNQRQVRLTRRERDERTTSHREQIRSRSYQSAREHHHSSSSSRSPHHHRHHAHHSSASRDRSNERTRRPESKSKYN